MRMLWCSDQHTVHQITPSTHILNNLTTFLRKENDLSKVDLIAFGGDWFERMIELPNVEAHVVLDWVRKFLDYAYKANPDIIVIWLEGTSSHDWGQPKHFPMLAPEGMDVRYIDTLCIQTFEKLDNMSIMFVPDNMGAITPDDVWERALGVLAESGLDTVDQIHFHGAFEFQMHTKARHKAHNLERWESIVKYCILAGHIHTPVQRGKLYTSGSFDRTRHGEEHPKGGYIIDLDLKTGEFKPVFWENKNALPYLTINVDQNIDPAELIALVHSFIDKRKLPMHSQLRIMGGASAVVNPMIAVLAKEYPQFGFKAENEKNDDEIIEEALFETKVYTGTSLTKTNMKESLRPHVAARFAALGIPMSEAETVLEEFTKK